MDTITANCPNCGTQYQLTEEQLSVAAGQVRCGSCMTVFMAVEQTAESEQNLLAETPPEEAVYDDDEHTSLSSLEDQLSDSFRSANDEGADGFGSVMDSTDEVDGVSAEVEMDEDWAEQLLDDDEEYDDEFTDVVSSAHSSALGADSSDFDDLGVDDALLLTPSEEDEELAFSEVKNPFEGDKDGILSRITPEPLEFHMAAGRRAIVKCVYALLMMVLLAGLAAQYLYFQFDDLARKPSWRPLYALACKELRCELPHIYNVDDLTLKHITVKSHAFYQNVLVIDTLLTNLAKIDQPFPLLDVYFTDKKGNLVAKRRFKPEEYLRGELASKKMMPRLQPVRLAIEIDDPGDKAESHLIRPFYGPDKS